MSKALDYIADLERENRLLGERCNQLLKDKGDLTDKIADIKANCDLAIEGRDIKIMELEKQVKDLEWQLQEVVKDNDNYQAENKRLEQQIEKLKCCGNCSKYDRNNRVCSRTKFSVIETLCNCSDDWELRR